MPRTVNILLCLAIAVGLAFLCNAQFKLTKLQHEYERLTGKYGVFKLTDPSKFCIKQIETENDMDFLWRIYQPEGISVDYKAVWDQGNWSGSSGIIGDGSEMLIRCRPVLTGSTESGLMVDTIAGDSSSRLRGTNKQVAEFVRKHWSELEIETIADGEHSSDDLLRFLTIRIPPPLLEKLLEQPGGKRYGRYANLPLFEYICGQPAAHAKAEAEAKSKAGQKSK